MRGSRALGIVLILIGLLAVPFFKKAIGSLLLLGLGVGMALLILVFVVGGAALVFFRGGD